MAQLDSVVVPGVMQVQHPMHFGWFPSNVSLASALGDIAAVGIGSLGITWQSSPALTEVEEVMCDWLRQLCGLSDEWRGVIQDTASTACLVAMLCARERASDFSQNRGGLQGEPQPLVVYASPQCHSSVPKAVLLAGFGSANLRHVELDPVTYALRPDALRAAMEADVAAGRKPAAVILGLGTTGTTAFDPIAPVVEIAREFGAWVHVDAAMAGSALLLPECRSLFDGIEGADSISWNPHKWMGTALDCSMYLTRDPEHLIRVMSTNPSYLRSAADGQVTQYKDWGIQLGRRFRALKLWFHLSIDGVDAIRARLRRDLDNAQWFAEQVAAEPGWRLLAPVPLQTICLRHEPPGLEGEALDAHTLAWVDRINASGRGLHVAGDARRPVDGARVDRCRVDRAPPRRGVVAPDAGDGRGGRSGVTSRAVARLSPDERRQAIIEATLAVAQRQGLGATTVRDVAHEMGTSSGLIHHYFASMDDVLAAAFEHAAGRRPREGARRDRRAARPDPPARCVHRVVRAGAIRLDHAAVARRMGRGLASTGAAGGVAAPEPGMAGARPRHRRARRGVRGVHHRRPRGHGLAAAVGARRSHVAGGRPRRTHHPRRRARLGPHRRRPRARRDGRSRGVETRQTVTADDESDHIRHGPGRDGCGLTHPVRRRAFANRIRRRCVLRVVNMMIDPHTDNGGLAVAAADRTAIRLVVIAAAGAVVALAIGTYGRTHAPTGSGVETFGFDAVLPMKAWFTTGAFALALVQLASALHLYGRVPLLRHTSPVWLSAVHRWSGTLAFLLTLPVAYHCLWALGFQQHRHAAARARPARLRLLRGVHHQDAGPAQPTPPEVGPPGARRRARRPAHRAVAHLVAVVLHERRLPRHLKPAPSTRSLFPGAPPCASSRPPSPSARSQQPSPPAR